MRMDGVQGGYMPNNEHEWSAIRISIGMDVFQGMYGHQEGWWSAMRVGDQHWNGCPSGRMHGHQEDGGLLLEVYCD